MWVISSRYTPVTNTSGWNAVVYCTCELIPLPLLTFYLGISVQNCEISQFTNWSPNREQPVESDRRSVWRPFILGKVNPVINAPLYPVKDKTVLVCRGQYTNAISVRLGSLLRPWYRHLQLLIFFLCQIWFVIHHEWWFFLSNAPITCPCGLRGPPSWAWQQCNRLLRLGRPWGAPLSRWCEWWYRRM